MIITSAEIPGMQTGKFGIPRSCFLLNTPLTRMLTKGDSL